jgi:hypothetical protein
MRGTPDIAGVPDLAFTSEYPSRTRERSRHPMRCSQDCTPWIIDTDLLRSEREPSRSQVALDIGVASQGIFFLQSTSVTSELRRCEDSPRYLHLSCNQIAGWSMERPIAPRPGSIRPSSPRSACAVRVSDMLTPGTRRAGQVGLYSGIPFSMWAWCRRPKACRSGGIRDLAVAGLAPDRFGTERK